MIIRFGAIVLTVAHLPSPLVSGAVAKPVIAASAPVASDADKQAARFEGLPVTDALIDQRPRIAARIAALPAHGPAPETFVLAVGGSGFQALFDREARRAAGVLTARTPGPSLVLSNSPDQVRRGILASPRTVALTIAAIGRRAVRGDTLIIYLASHGGRDANIEMDAPRLDFEDLTATALAGDLQRAGIQRRIIIISACFGATWIKPLASPTTILLTAADVDRTSFGCDDSRELTVFGEAMLRELSGRQSLAQAFARAKLRIAAAERAERELPSRPQSWVGNAMAAIWSAPR
ncbi:C13 family peptidase [Sphingosinicellaceae bacterium]|nr:C13 family peptidase [Sphingosinicellaceae bacterium]